MTAMEPINHIEISKIEMSPWDRSKDYSETIILKIRRDIRLNGGLDKNRPIIVNEKNDGNFTIIDGGAKFLSAKLENLESVPVIVVHLDAKDAALKFLDINIQHRMNNLTIGLIGLLIKKENNNLSIGTIARMLSEITGKDKSNICKFIKAAEVYTFTEQHLTETEKVILYKKSSKLSRISTIPAEAWLTLVQYIASSQKCENLNKAVNLAHSILNLENSQFWCDLFFPLNSMVSMSLKNQTGIIAIKESIKKLNDALQCLQANKDKAGITTLKQWLIKNAFKNRSGRAVGFNFRKVIKYAHRIAHSAESRTEDLIYGNCLEKIDLLKDNIFDGCICDAPYGIAMRSIGSSKIPIINDTRTNATSLIKSLANKLHRKMKNNTYTVVFCSDKMFEVFKSAFTSAGYKYICTSIWKKNNHSQNDLLTSPLIITEFMLFFRKGRPTLFEGRNNVFEYGIPQDRIHPTQKPIDLLKSLLECISCKNGYIIDPFCGSGSTAKACQLTNRSFWTCEISKTHYEKAYNRLFVQRGEAAA